MSNRPVDDGADDTGPVSVDLTIDGENDPLLGTLAHRFTALTAHKEGSARVPDGATLLATNDACPVQAYRVGERLYATQFHPEPTPHAFTERMAVYRDDGYFPANDYDTVAGRVLAASVTEPVRMIRAFAPLRNVDAWYEAFGVKEGDAHYVKPEDRVRIW